MSALAIQLLGDFQIRYQGAPVAGFESPRLQSLLAYLVLHHDAPQSRKHLAFSLWQDSSEQQAHGNLRSLVHRLRKALPDADHFVLADAQTLQWRMDSPFTVDALEFQELTTQPQESVAPEHIAQRLSSAISLYHGDLLPACYDEWLLTEREHLRERFVDALAQLIVLSEQARDYTAAIGYARRLLEADPLGEEAYRKLMQMYARIGDRANLVRVYQTCVAVLKRELDTEPSALTRELFEELRRAETSVERPVVLRGQVKPNLPSPLTSFVGRTRELGIVHALIEQARLVTLTGVGGCGKTRLAIQAAHEVENDFRDGIWFVDLAPLSAPEDVPRTCAAVFGLREQPDISTVELLADYMREKNLLLVLDNCEHLLSACAPFVQSILQAAPDVRILATSREQLNLVGEALLVVPPLSLPDADHPMLESLAHSDAVQLFATRASFVLPTFRLNHENIGAVAQLCKRLDGIPLAIELAAARARALTPNQIAARLDDALAVLTRGSMGMPARHQTMRAVLDWSDALLADAERVLFRRLSVFTGSFTLETVESVCSDDKGLARELILDLLSGLIDKSLLMAVEVEKSEEARYRLLEPIRQYAREKLELAGEEEMVGARQLDWCVALGESIQPELEGAKQAAAFARLEREYDNLRSVLGFALRTERRETGLRLAAALERFWLSRSHPVEGRQWFRQLLGRELPKEGVDQVIAHIHPTVLARALAVAGLLAHRQNYEAEAEAYYQESLRLCQELHDEGGVAMALNKLGDVAMAQGDYAHAAALYEESLHLHRKRGNPRGVVSVLISLGVNVSDQGDIVRACSLYEEGLSIIRPVNDVWMIAVLLNNLAEMAKRQGEWERAETLLTETLTLRRALADQRGQAIALRLLGEVMLKQQNWKQAGSLFKQSLVLYQGVNDKKEAALCLIGLAGVAQTQGRAECAARLLGMSEQIRQMIHSSLSPEGAAAQNALLEQVRAVLDSRTFDSAWKEGRMLTYEQAILDALQEPD